MQIENEKSLLILTIQNPTIIDDYNIKSDMFESTFCRNTFGAIESLIEKGEDVITYRKLLIESGIDEVQAKDLKEVIENARDEYSVENITPDYFIEEFFEMTRQRLSDKAIESHKKDEIDRTELIEQLEKIDTLGVNNNDGKSMWFDEAMTKKFGEIMNPESSGKFLKSGFIDLDDISKLGVGTLNIVGARPSVGKTAFMLQLGRNVVKTQPATIDLFSGETLTMSLMNRVVSAETNIPAQKIRTGIPLDEHELNRLAVASGDIAKMNICVTQMTNQTVKDIYKRVRKSKEERPNELHVVMIDHLGLIESHSKGERHDIQIGAITRYLKMMAVNEELIVILLCQLSRGVEQREDKRPTLKDLKNSGNIEEDADDVWMLYRDDYYIKDTEDTNTIEVIVRKAREGSLGTVKLFFDKDVQKMASIHSPHNYSPPA